MNMDKAQWIDSYVTELSRLGTSVDPAHAVDMGEAMYLFFDDADPVAIARLDFNE
jgi:hypothetical protein